MFDSVGQADGTLTGPAPITQHPVHFKDGFENARNIQPIPFRPTSVLHPIALSPNGYSQQDASRRLFTGHGVSFLPTSNGQSESTYQKLNQFNPYHAIGQ